jgi:hypothetical protein
MTAETDREERFWRRLIMWSAVGSALILLLLRCDYRNGQKFDREKWLNYSLQQQLSGDCIRGAMVSGLETRYLRRGSDRATIEKLLGPDDSSPAMGNSCREYLIGMCSGFRIDYDGLIVCYDPHGKLTESYTVQH